MKSATNFRIVMITNDSYDSSYQIAKVIINEHLAACCTIIPNCLSIFGWQGNICERNEFITLIKTSDDMLPMLKDRIMEIHHDEVPEIIAVSMDSALSSYLDWMSESLKARTDVTAS